MVQYEMIRMFIYLLYNKIPVIRISCLKNLYTIHNIRRRYYKKINTGKCMGEYCISVIQSPKYKNL